VRENDIDILIRDGHRVDTYFIHYHSSLARRRFRFRRAGRFFPLGVECGFWTGLLAQTLRGSVE
jgi:hypothetical protein